MMNDIINKSKEISLLSSENTEEILRYNIDYKVILENGLPISVSYTKITRTEFKDGVDRVDEIGEEEAPYFMLKNLEDKELTGWV